MSTSSFKKQGADVVENFLPKQSCFRFLNASKRYLNTFKLLLTFTKNFEGPLAFMYGYLNFNMSSQSRNSIFLTRLFQEKFSTTSDPRWVKGSFFNFFKIWKVDQFSLLSNVRKFSSLLQLCKYGTNSKKRSFLAHPEEIWINFHISSKKKKKYKDKINLAEKIPTSNYIRYSYLDGKKIRQKGLMLPN